MAEQHPQKTGVVVATGTTRAGTRNYEKMSFSELDQLSSSYARGFERVGISRGTRTVLMLKPSLDFFAVVFALFKVGAVVILADPRVGVGPLRRCLREVDPEAFVGIPLAHVARLVLGLPTVKICVTRGPRLFWGGHKLQQLRDDREEPFPVTATDPDELAAILFTSGSTGIPKGAVYTHGIFDAQVRLLKQMFAFGADEVDLCTFPLFALFDPALGMTAVVPDMDASRPGSADPEKLVAAIEDQGCTTMFGSPALVRNLANFTAKEGRSLPMLRRVLSAGAPVPHDVLETMHKALRDEVEVFTPYGATEALPVCLIGSRTILKDTASGTAEGKGICVGRPVDEVTVRIISIGDEPIDQWSDDLQVAPGEIGEITVQGPIVTPGYFGRQDQTALAKIHGHDGGLIHRMGDLGWIDPEGRVWMCGRKAHRVQTAAGPLFTIPVERVFDNHAGVRRTALVGVGDPGAQLPVLLVEPNDAAHDTSALLDELRQLGERCATTEPIHDFLLHPEPFPVDIRHNAKIRREALVPWAEKCLR
ncbi:MAG TPA: peptide synthase [Deltaproteobacteria bacterium]|nr:peptide synthase [Deltaproteobacteria bacterium]HCP48321.1 peptide synthase [Deltaproteobacteria bacterium]